MRLFLFLFALTWGCTPPQNRTINNALSTKKLIECPEIRQDLLVGEYTERCQKCINVFGHSVSTFYTIDDVISIDLNRDMIRDTIAMFRPFYCGSQTLSDTYEVDSIYISGKKPTDLIVIYDGSTREASVFTNITRGWSWQLGGESLVLEKSSGGFAIEGEWGHGNTWGYRIYINQTDSNLTVDSVKMYSTGLFQYDKLFETNCILREFSPQLLDSLRSVCENQ